MGFGKPAGIPNGAQFGAEALADGDIGLVMDGVGGQMELAPLPGGSAEYGSASCAQAGMIVGDDKFDAAHTARDEAVEEATPVHFRFF